MSYHNEIGNDSREGLKKDKIGQSAAKRLWRKPGEGSTTRIDHLTAKAYDDEIRRGSKVEFLVNPKRPTPTRKLEGEDIV